MANITIKNSYSHNKCTISYHGESKNRLQFLCLLTFNPIITLKLHSITKKCHIFHVLTIKAKRILGLKVRQIKVQIIMTCA